MKDVFKIGDAFSVDDRIYILSQIGVNEVCLIGLDTGNRLAEAVRVGSPMLITQREIQSISGRFSYDEEFFPLEQGIKPFMANNTFKIGDTFMHEDELFIMSQVKPKHVCLIHIFDGNRLIEPIQVQNVNAITQDEFALMTNSQWISFGSKIQRCNLNFDINLEQDEAHESSLTIG